MKEAVRPWFERPRLSRHAPRRGPANFYRAASDNPEAIGGVALDSVEAAATAAVRLGYKIAEAQIDRTARLAKRMRAAGDQAAGPGSDRKALDATEQLVFKTLMAGLGWFEGLASDGGNPLRRLAIAQYRLLGASLGLLDVKTASADGPSSPESRPMGDAERLPMPDRPTTRRPRGPRPVPRIRHLAGRGKNQAPRAVRIREWELNTAPAGTYNLVFYADEPERKTMAADLIVTKTETTLELKASARQVAAGLYKAAICDPSGSQLGYIEISM